MSLINDALKQARQTPPPIVSHPRPIFRSERSYGTPTSFWVVSGLLILLIVGVTFLLGWYISDHAVRNIATTPVNEAVKPAVVELPRLAAPVPVTNPPEEEAVTPLPALQGIFYSPTSPTAIVNGKTVGVGDMIGEYRVKAISKSAVTLEGPDGKEKQITL
jgi:hypothetical protein